MTRSIKTRLTYLEQQTRRSGWSPRQLREMAKNLQGVGLKPGHVREIDKIEYPEREFTGTPRTGRKI